LRTLFQLYRRKSSFARIEIVLLLASFVVGCAGTITSAEYAAHQNELVEEINQVRTVAGLQPLEKDEFLMKAAADRVSSSAAKGASRSDDNRLPALVAAGSFARFALSHEISAPTFDEAINKLTTDPVSQSKILHPKLNHVGVGLLQGSDQIYGIVDLARVVDTVDLKQVQEDLTGRIQKKRTANSADPVEFSDSLQELGKKIATQFMDNGKISSEDLIAEAQSTIDKESFALGRVTITFQVIGVSDAVVIPSMISDPALSYIGMGLAQGNHAEHEAGSLAVVLFLAQPQNARSAKRSLVDLPPPKAVPGKRASRKGSQVEQAWVATLTGNHRKAASLFEQAYRKYKKPKLLYEAARAHARNGDLEKALAKMLDYAEVAPALEKGRAMDFVERLENGESIFSTSKETQMTIEAKRFFVIGQRLFEQEEWDGAIDAFQQAYTYAKHPDIVYNIGLVYLRAGEMGEALNHFAEFQREVPEAKSVEQARQAFEIGVALYQAGQFEAASKHFAMAYGFLPFPELVYNMALCHKALGEKEEALQFLREFLDADPPKKERGAVKEMILDLEGLKK
jgi:tetratricopeptide (TPR) repeat protein